MARNLYMLAGTLGFFALACVGLSFSNVAQQPGSPGDVALWRTMGIGFVVLALLAALGGTFSHLFEQAERRADQARMERRRRRAELED
jgi:hypothetical protein